MPRFGEQILDGGLLNLRGGMSMSSGGVRSDPGHVEHVTGWPPVLKTWKSP